MAPIATPKILVLGATGPAGLCLLRELLFRKHNVVAYVRNPSKIPEDLKLNSQLEVIQGEMDNKEQLSLAVSKTNKIISLLGPNTLTLPSNTMYPDFYRNVFVAMRQHNVKRIWAMGTLTIPDPADHFSLFRLFIVNLLWLITNSSYQNIIGIGNVFDKETEGLDWTLFRIAHIPGEPDEASWKKDREGEVRAGAVADAKWSMTVRRSLLAKWLVDQVEEGGEAWIGKRPAVSGS